MEHSLHINYEYVLDFCSKQKATTGTVAPVILDYGCGRGETVTTGRARGLDLYGAEIFYTDGKGREVIAELGLLGSVIREIKDGRLDFPDAFFDVVVSNQVMEHVVDLDAVLDEIDRVLKPGGVSLHLFPSRDVWREGHCGIPFIHWFRNDSPLRRPYMLALRRMGMGFFKKNKPPEKFTDTFLPWLEKYTHYRTRPEIFRSFRRQFSIELIEDDYICFRLEKTGRKAFVPLVHFPLFKPLVKELFRKLGGLVLLAKKETD